MVDREYFYTFYMIINGVKNAVISDAKAVSILTAVKLLDAEGSRIFLQSNEFPSQTME